MQKKILVIEDNSDIANLIKVNLQYKNMQVSLARDGSTGLDLAQTGDFDLIVLDLMLPGIDGMEVCRHLRQEKNFTPILMLTAKTSELDRVLGLEIGADDYLTKPFSVPELLARVNALLRRSDQYQQAEVIQSHAKIRFDNLCIDPEARQVDLGDHRVDLTAKEFDLLCLFAKNPGRVYSRNQLLNSIWGYAHEGYEHTVNSHINRLRAKIEKDPAQPQYVITVWGVGYKFNNEISAS